ncbi:MAG: helix-turn-helix transcriptional regulator [Clostridium butyricum]|nr:helix-turn-helix transcriptional regulator [Clostridium butyricum]
MKDSKIFSKDIVDGVETDLIKLLYYDYERDGRDSYTTHECNRLCRVLDGEKKIKVNNETNLIYSDDEFVLLKPKSKVEVVTNKPTKALVLEISNDLISYINNKLKYEFKENADFNLKSNYIFKDFNVKNLMDDVIDIVGGNESNKEFLIDLRAQEITYELFKHRLFNDIDKLNSNNVIRKSISIMNDNLLSDITISDISYSLGMSLTNFSTIFKKATGIAPNKYLTNLKLQKAKEMLEYQSVTEVAFSLGYDNISYFINIFKRNFGVTPKQYSLRISGKY